MKKRNIAAILILCGLLCACGSNAVTTESENPTISEIDVDSSDEQGSEESDMESSNRTIIAQALGVDEDKRNIRFILANLDTIGVTQVVEAELVEENGESVLDLVADTQKKYRIYMTGSGNVEAIKDLDSGEWLIKSER